MEIHFIFLSMVWLLFPDFQINRPPPREIEVSLLSLRVEEKPIIIPLPPSQEKSQIKEGVKKPLQHEKKEEPLRKKELEPEPPLPFQTEAKVTPISNPLPLSLEHGKREIGSKNEEITIEEPLTKAVGISLPSEAESSFKEGENHHLFKGGLFNKESPSVATPPPGGCKEILFPITPLWKNHRIWQNFHPLRKEKSSLLSSGMLRIRTPSTLKRPGKRGTREKSF